MITAVLAGVLALGMQQPTDTTFAVRAGASLELDVQSGSVVVRSWDRDEMRVQATHDGATRVRIRNRDSGVSIEAEEWRGHGPGKSVSFEITVPRSFGVEIEGINVRAHVENVRGPVVVENVQGAIVVRGVNGDVDVESVTGSLTVEDVRGSVRASATNQGVVLRNVTGTVSAETVNGNITLHGIESAAVEAHTVNGFVHYDGSIRDGGRYAIGTHNGEIRIAIAERTNATLRITTMNGKVQSAFPVRIGSMREGTTQVTLGSGSARVELESFNGSINLVRPTGR